jgi:hypothetical protein
VNGTGAVVTGLATLVFLITKFAQGAWIVMLAVPAIVILFQRIHAYYQRAALELDVGVVPAKPVGTATLVIVPVSNLSRLTRFAISEALSLSPNVIAVSVVIDQPDEEQAYGHDLARQWAEWNPGPPLKVLNTQFTSIVEPVCAFIDEERAKGDRQIVVLIPSVVPTRWRYRLLHNQIDLVLSAELRKRADVVVARVQMPLEVPARSRELANKVSNVPKPR